MKKSLALALGFIALASALAADPTTPSALASPASLPKPGLADRFSFVALGCMPYQTDRHPLYENLLAEINRHAPAFTVHCGDTLQGNEPIDDDALLRIRTWFDSLESACIYTPGDNEWTDANPARSPQPPLHWLRRIREIYFAEERSLGRRPLPLVTQRRDPAFAKFVENARWEKNRIVFATVHVVGSLDNRQESDPAALAEHTERSAAAAAWVHVTIAHARATDALGVAIFCQANPFLMGDKPGRHPAFKLFLDTLEAETRAFGRPVLLVHADDHHYRLERAPAFERGGEPIPNFTRLETFGGQANVHGVLVTVDPGSPDVFLAGPLLVPGAPLPILPRPRAK